MAWTISKEVTVFGNKGVSLIQASADSAESNIDTGLSRIDGFVMGVVSMTTTASYHVAKNSGSTGTALAGYLGTSGFTSGDVVHFIVYGKR
jgi:hypothetical protein